MAATRERRAMVAVFAIFALLVQAMFATAAMAASSAGHDGISICAPTGQNGAPDGNGAPASDQHSCNHCICAAPAAAPEACVATVGRVRYATPIVVDADSARLRPGRGLAAPPPPATGPPSIV